MPKLTFKNVTLLLCVTSFACNGPNGWSNKCPFERFDWMEISAGYNSKELIEIAGTIENAARADAKLVAKNVTASTQSELSASIKSLIEKSTSSKTKVSQEFFQAYVRQRTGVCNIWTALHDGTLKSPKAREEAELLFIQISKDFSQLKQNAIAEITPTFELKEIESDSVKLVISNPEKIDFQVSSVKVQNAKQTTSQINDTTFKNVFNSVDFARLNNDSLIKRFGNYTVLYKLDTSRNQTTLFFNKEFLLGNRKDISLKDLDLRLGINIPELSTNSQQKVVTQ